jgi:PKD repeat protein
MNGFSKAVLAAVFALCFSTLFAQSRTQVSVVAEYVSHHINVYSSSHDLLEQNELHYPGASFIKVHFDVFRLPPGMTVEVRNPDGTESYLYSRDYMDSFTYDAESGDDGITSFYAMSISGDTAIIEIHGKPGQVKSMQHSGKHRVRVDHVVRGLESFKRGKTPKDDVDDGGLILQALGPADPGTESTCGEMERYDAVCWAGSDPAAYDRARPVAKAVIGIKSCTAWRVGSDNHMFTNNHCAASQSETSSMEIWFNYERSICGGESIESVVKVSGNKLLSTDYTLDYSLFTVNDFSSIESFGNLGLEVREAALGEQIYIPQHGDGNPKQIAIDSDLNFGGICQVDDENHAGRAEGTDIGYFCDTSGGSSGSPVVLAESNKAIALHHSGGCYNSGVKMSEIWPKVSRHFRREVPEGDFDPANLPPPPDQDENPVASFGFACSYLDCTFDGSGSHDAEGALVAYAWVFGDGSESQEIYTTHSFAAGGSFNVSLTVTDSVGNTDMTTKTVTVTEPDQNLAPTAEFSFNCHELNCAFDASASSDSDGAIASYSWAFGDGNGATGMTASHSFSDAGSYSVSLTVADTDGASSTLTRTVSVETVPPVVVSIELAAIGGKAKGAKWADLSWAGSESSSMRIYRDGSELAVTENIGTYRDSSVGKRAKSAVYQVCEATGMTCSNEVEVSF